MNPSIFYFFLKCIDGNDETPALEHWYTRVDPDLDGKTKMNKYLELLLECESFLFNDDDQDDVIKVDKLCSMLHRHFSRRDELLLYCKDIINTVNSNNENQINCKLRLAASSILTFDCFDKEGNEIAWQKGRNKYEWLFGMCCTRPFWIVYEKKELLTLRCF